jgi:hypothetical protein
MVRNELLYSILITYTFRFLFNIVIFETILKKELVYMHLRYVYGILVM